MNINKSPAKYSSIVEIGELVADLEKNTGDKYLKLHRGVMDVETINLDFVAQKIDFNQKKMQQYGGNDGDGELLKTIKDKYHLENHFVMTAPGGMAALDLIINSLSDKIFWIPKYHWGSWNKILEIHDKEIKCFDDFNILDLKADLVEGMGVVMLCYPSNPTGYSPTLDELNVFIKCCKEKNITVILDMPYYFLFNELNDKINELYFDNVIIASSFSKSIGLSGYRVGYVATKNKELYDTMKIRSLYKYNSISNVSQSIINCILTSDEGRASVSHYQSVTTDNIKKNIAYLKTNNLLFDEYRTLPVGPFVIVNKTFDELMAVKISSVPLNKFVITSQVSASDNERMKNLSRIVTAVDHNLFKAYFDNLLVSISG